MFACTFTRESGILTRSPMQTLFQVHIERSEVSQPCLSQNGHRHTCLLLCTSEYIYRFGHIVANLRLQHAHQYLIVFLLLHEQTIFEFPPTYPMLHRVTDNDSGHGVLIVAS